MQTCNKHDYMIAGPPPPPLPLSRPPRKPEMLGESHGQLRSFSAPVALLYQGFFHQHIYKHPLSIFAFEKSRFTSMGSLLKTEKEKTKLQLSLIGCLITTSSFIAHLWETNPSLCSPSHPCSLFFFKNANMLVGTHLHLVFSIRVAIYLIRTRAFNNCILTIIIRNTSLFTIKSIC